MSEHEDSPEVRAAIEREKRLWTIEQDIVGIERDANDRASSIDSKLDRLIEEVTALKEHVRVQNGRVGKAETAIINHSTRFDDFESLRFNPLKAMVDSIGSQVKDLWEQRVLADGERSGKSQVLRFQWKVTETLGKIIGSSVVIGGAILLLRLMGLNLGG